MLHPNSTAIDYIWSRFSECYFSDETRSIALEMNKMSRALAHRPFNTKGEEYKKFCKKQLSKIEQLENKYPEIDFKKDKLQIYD
jgi:heterodisulfide reductase subunit B